MSVFFGRSNPCNANAKPNIDCRKAPGGRPGVRICRVVAGPGCGRTFTVDPSPAARASAHRKKQAAGDRLQRQFTCTRNKTTGQFTACHYLGPRGQ